MLFLKFFRIVEDLGAGLIKVTQKGEPECIIAVAAQILSCSHDNSEIKAYPSVFVKMTTLDFMFSDTSSSTSSSTTSSTSSSTTSSTSSSTTSSTSSSTTSSTSSSTTSSTSSSTTSSTSSSTTSSTSSPIEKNATDDYFWSTVWVPFWMKDLPTNACLCLTNSVIQLIAGQIIVLNN